MMSQATTEIQGILEGAELSTFCPHCHESLNIFDPTSRQIWLRLTVSAKGKKGVQVDDVKPGRLVSRTGRTLMPSGFSSKATRLPGPTNRSSPLKMILSPYDLAIPRASIKRRGCA